MSVEVWRFDAAAFCRGRRGTFSITGWICVAGDVCGSLAGVALSASPRDLRGRCGTFTTSIDVRGSLATKWVRLTPLHFA